MNERYLLYTEIVHACQAQDCYSAVLCSGKYSDAKITAYFVINTDMLQTYKRADHALSQAAAGVVTLVDAFLPMPTL